MKDDGAAELDIVEFGNEGEEGADNGPIGVFGEMMELLLLVLLEALLLLNPAKVGVEVYMVLLGL